MAYKGFWLSRTGGPDAPWIARHDNGHKLRADTIRGIKQFVTYEIQRGAV